MATTVKYYNGANLIGEGTVAPDYAFSWTTAPAGNTVITAKRFVDGVEQESSSAVNVVVNAVAQANLLLDDYAGAKAAYSISRKLDKDYAGACVRVYKHSNTSYLDIGFVNDELDTASLLSFAAGGNIAVKTVYDQTGNGHDWQDDYIVAGFPTLAPQIVVSGALITRNGKPVITMSGGGTNLSTLFTTAAPLSTDFSVFGNTNTYAGVGFGVTDAEGYYGLMQSSGTGITNNNVGTPSTYINGALFTGNGGALFTACNPGLVIVSFTNLDLTKFTKLNADHSIASIKAISHFAEKIIYDSDQSANRVAIQNNMNSFYAAY